MHEVGPLLAKGRAADVFAYGDDLVLRRYRSDHDSIYEADVMRHVAAHGYPVPNVVDVNGPDMVMERLDGTTMLTDVGKRPWKIFRHTSTLASLIHRLHDVPAPGWLKDRHENGTTIVHLDLHPDNVMLSSRGPVVIDWSNAGRGNPDAEVADLWLILSSAQVPGGFFDKAIAKIGRGLLVSSLLKHFDENAVRNQLSAALRYRSRDRNMSEAELARMQRLVDEKGL